MVEESESLLDQFTCRGGALKKSLFSSRPFPSGLTIPALNITGTILAVKCMGFEVEYIYWWQWEEGIYLQVIRRSEQNPLQVTILAEGLLHKFGRSLFVRLGSIWF